jgi:hypothetical protein
MTNMKLVATALVLYFATASYAQEPQTWSGVLSENTCGASHKAMAASLGVSDRACAFHCLKSLAKYVIVDDKQNVIPVANQDFAGIPLRLARPVRVTGVLTDKGIVISRIEPPLVHAHIGHVMTAWRETPGTVGLLTIALSDARIAAAHVLLLAKSSGLDDMKLHAGHVLHALDPTVETTGPASGYGVRKAGAGAVQHVGFAAAVDNASPAVKERSSAVTVILTSAMKSVDKAITAAQQVRAAQSSDAAAAGIRDLTTLVEEITRELQKAEQEMRVMMKTEGL